MAMDSNGWCPCPRRRACSSFFFFSSRRRHTRFDCDWSSDVCSSDLLGKMTIHMGDSAKGLALFEQSIAAYPLALTYRNLAVYWNSERKREIADGYVQKALALDPKDPYNLIFAATYMADSGRGAEALRIAQKNEDLLSASYNLAAIYALVGNKGKAMEMLRRHFYQYERYDAVRAKEMWEARVDYVFASMKDDAEFVKLTAMAN